MNGMGVETSRQSRAADIFVRGSTISLRGDVFAYEDRIVDVVPPDLCTISAWMAELRRGVRIVDVTFKAARDVEFEFLDLRRLSLTVFLGSSCRGGVRDTPVRFLAETGDIFLISPIKTGKRSPFFTLESGKRYQMLSYFFDDGVFESLLDDLGVTLPSSLQGRLYLPETALLDRRGVHSRVQSLFEEIRGVSLKGMGRELFLQSKACELLIEYCLLLKGRSSERAPLTRSQTQKAFEAKAILLERLNRPTTIGHLARLVGLNECSLKRAFRQVHGISVHAFQMEARLQRARAQLMSSDGRLAEIAYDLGFAHQSHFTAAFRKRFGLPPRSFQRRYAQAAEGGPGALELLDLNGETRQPPI